MTSTPAWVTGHRLRPEFDQFVKVRLIHLFQNGNCDDVIMKSTPLNILMVSEKNTIPSRDNDTMKETC